MSLPCPAPVVSAIGAALITWTRAVRPPAGSAGGVNGSSAIMAQGTAPGSGGLVVSTPARTNVYGSGNMNCFGTYSPAPVRKKLDVVPLTRATNPWTPLGRSR